MKNVTSIFYSSLFIISSISCFQNHHNSRTSFTVSESEHKYQVLAEYPEQKTREVERYLNKKIGDKNNLSFVNATIDAQLTLEDGSKIHMKNNPGNLKIELNKDENSDAFYQQIKAVSEGLKEVINDK